MNVKHEKFIQGILEGKTQTQAYIDAGYSEKNARVNASRLMTKDNISGAIQQRRDEISQLARVQLMPLRRHLLNWQKRTRMMICAGCVLARTFSTGHWGNQTDESEGKTAQRNAKSWSLTKR